MVSNASDSRCTNASAEPNAGAVVPLGIKWATSACERKAKCITGCNECSEATLSSIFISHRRQTELMSRRQASGLFVCFVLLSLTLAWVGETHIKCVIFEDLEKKLRQMLLHFRLEHSPSQHPSPEFASELPWPAHTFKQQSFSG